MLKQQPPTTAYFLTKPWYATSCHHLSIKAIDIQSQYLATAQKNYAGVSQQPHKVNLKNLIL
jgi:hypothetical protein